MFTPLHTVSYSYSSRRQIPDSVSLKRLGNKIFFAFSSFVPGISFRDRRWWWRIAYLIGPRIGTRDCLQQAPCLYSREADLFEVSHFKETDVLERLHAEV